MRIIANLIVLASLLFGQLAGSLRSNQVVDATLTPTPIILPSGTSTQDPAIATPTPSSTPTSITDTTTPDATNTPVTNVPTGMPNNQVMPRSAQALTPALGCVGDTCTFQVSSSSDDAGSNPVAYCSYSTMWNEVYFGLCQNNTPIVSGFRFTNVTIDKGTRIAQAYLEFTVDGPYTDQVSLNFYGEATGNSSTFGLYSPPGSPTRPALTQNFATWNISSSSTDHWELGMTKDTPDLTQVIQEIINRNDWSSGNALAIIAESLSASGVNRHRRVVGYDRPVWYPGYQYAAKLVIKLANIHPVIFVPGTGATELYNNSDFLWMNLDKALLDLSSSFLDPLQFDSTGQPINSSTYPARVMQMEKFSDVYQTFTNYMTNKISTDFPGVANYELGQVGTTQATNDHVINYQPGQNFWLFPVDFRNDLSGQADRLDVLVNDVLQDTGATQLDIVTHSQGGLVVRQYITDSNHASKVHRLITLGTPYLGTPVVFRALRYGWDFGIPVLLNASEVKKLAQNWPGAYEQLPANDQYFMNSIGYFKTTRDINGDGQPEGYLTSRASTDALLKTNPILDDDLSTTTHYNASLITQAEQFEQNGIQGWSTQAARNIDRTVIVGTGKCTIQTFYEFVQHSRYGNQVKVDAFQNNGDDTVPKFSADMQSGRYSDTAHIYYVDAGKIGGHSSLPNGLAKEVASILINGEQPSTLSTQPTSSHCTQVELFSQANLQITDTFGNITGAVQSYQSYQTNIPNSDFFLFPDNQIAVIPTGGPYTFSVSGIGDGTFDLRIREWQDDNVMKTILYKDVPVTSTTKAALTYISGSDVPMLGVDENGDGIIDLTLSPSSVLGSQGNQIDLTPPTTSIQANGAAGLNGWYTSNVTVALSAIDNPGGTGVLKTIYSLDGGATFQTYSGPFVISQEGTTTILAQSSDQEGNEEYPPVSLTLKIDKTPPVLNVTANPTILWPPSHKMVTIQTTVQAADNLDPNPVVKLVSVTSNEPDSGLGDILIQPDGTILLRAERLGSGNGRIYTIAYSAQDAAGNITTKSVMVTVPHNK